MVLIEMEKFLDGGILREDPFREKIKNASWEDYRDKQVLIRGCSSVPIPTWAYLIVSAHVSQVASAVYYGEEKSPILIFSHD